MTKMNLYKFVLTGLLLLVSQQTIAQQLAGSWSGTLEVAPGKAIEMVFHIKREAQGYSATVDVPAQKQYGLPFSSVSLKGDQVSLSLKAANLSFVGQLAGTTIKGEYSQGAFKAPLTLKAAESVAKRQARQQEPKGPLPYAEQGVQFENKAAKVTLSGTLTLPDSKPQAAVILISGSGPTNRDSDVAGHKLFLVLADQLTRQGVAVLRYDDRGVGESTGDFTQATSADFASDAYAALTFLRNHPALQSAKIGYVGHSEGGLIAAIAEANYPGADFMVSMAGVGTSGAQILIDQSYYIQKLMGMDEAALAKDDLQQKEVMAAIKSDYSKAQLKALLLKHGNKEKAAEAKATRYLGKWFKYFVKAEPAGYFAKLKLPVFALNGDLDCQVLAPQNIEAFKKGVATELLTTKIYSGLNHLFQPAQTGLPNEYMTIETTISDKVALDISQWIKKLG